MTFPRRRLPLAETLAPALVLMLALAVTPSCGGGGGDQTVKFLGTWTFSSGQLTPMCALITTPFSLTGLPVVFTKVDDSTISLGIGAACTVKFKVSGAKATVEPNQTCTLDVGALGPQTVAIVKWTLMLSGDQIDNDIAGSILICTASGTAVLTRGGPDAGAPDADAGKHEGGAAVANADGGAPEAGATDGAPEAGATDAALEASADGGSEAGSGDGAGAETGSPDAAGEGG
jgi:hypothetical protein